MVAKTSSLTTGEQRKLKQLESVIDQHKRAFVEVGNALRAIQTERLYTDVDETFEGYCRKRWGYAKSHAYRLIEAAQVVQSLSPIGDIKPPDNEAQARVLASLETEQQQAVWVKATETAPKGSDGAPKVTAAHVRRVADEVTGKAKPKPPRKEPKPAPPKEEPNELGAKKDRIADFIHMEIAGQPPHVLILVADWLREFADAIGI